MIALLGIRGRASRIMLPSKEHGRASPQASTIVLHCPSPAKLGGAAPAVLISLIRRRVPRDPYTRLRAVEEAQRGRTAGDRGGGKRARGPARPMLRRAHDGDRFHPCRA